MHRFYLVPALMIGLLVPPSAPAQVEPAGDSFKLTSGTPFEVRLMTTLSTRTNQEGDPFSARLVESIIYKGEDIIPVGSTLEGRITYTKEAGRITGKSEMRLVADSLTTPQDVRYLIIASVGEAHGMDGAKVKDKEGTIQGSGTGAKGGAIETGIGAGAGAAVGGLAAGGTGALYGAGIGMVAAGLHHLFKRGKDVTLPIGTEMTFTLSRDTILQKAPVKNAEPTDTTVEKEAEQ